jgi:hypothetical protein
MDPKYIVKISGKEHVTYDGLLDEAHAKGLVGISVEVTQQPREDNGWTTICTAMVSFGDGRHYSEIGDANPKNCNSKIAAHSIRMAATRAKARALRDALNIKGAAAEELGGDDFHPVESNRKPAAPSAKPGKVSEAQLKRLYTIVNESGIKPERVKAAIKERFGCETSKDLTVAQYDELIDDMLPALAAL